MIVLKVSNKTERVERIKEKIEEKIEQYEKDGWELWNIKLKDHYMNDNLVELRFVKILK